MEQEEIRVRPSSYRALRSAVSSLARLDDFYYERIGSGFFSEVFKAKHRITGQVMALKMNTEPTNKANMLREVQLINRLCHPNILRLHGVCVHEGQLHALTEYISGGNLEQLLDSDLYLSWTVRMGLSLDIARGLQYLHSKGIFHRDLTSKNCLVRCENGTFTAVVGDFGLAEKIPDYSVGKKEHLSIVGSPYWMAPEMLRGEVYDEKVDVYSFGIILCEIIARIQADPDYLPRTADFGLDVEAFGQMVGDCPQSLFDLAVGCCHMYPETRPSFSDVVVRLEWMITEKQRDDAPVALKPITPDQPLSRSQSDIFSLPPVAANASPQVGTPGRINPFSLRKDLNGGHIKLYDSPSRSVMSLTFTLPPPQLEREQCASPTLHRGPERHSPPRRCQSLPNSLELGLRNLLHSPTKDCEGVISPGSNLHNGLTVYQKGQADSPSSNGEDDDSGVSSPPLETLSKERVEEDKMSIELNELCQTELMDCTSSPDDAMDSISEAAAETTADAPASGSRLRLNVTSHPSSSASPFSSASSLQPNILALSISNRPPLLSPLPCSDNNNIPLSTDHLLSCGATNGYHTNTSVLPEPCGFSGEPQEGWFFSCLGRCFVGLPFWSLCLRSPAPSCQVSHAGWPCHEFGRGETTIAATTTAAAATTKGLLSHGPKGLSKGQASHQPKCAPPGVCPYL